MELRYRFKPDSAAPREFTVTLDDETLESAAPAGEPPAWTRLENRRCEACPLPTGTSHCPVAVRIAPLVEGLKDHVSYEQADITVETAGRSYSKRAPMQIGISGLFGLVMATSGCPVLDKLRPMAFTHLPFPSLRESMYRAISMYLLGQFFVSRKGGAPDWSLEGLAEIFRQVARVNAGLAERLRPLGAKDASVNAVINLDCFATFTKSAIDKSSMAWLESLFRPYWDAP